MTAITMDQKEEDKIEIGLTYSGELPTLINILDRKKLLVNYTIDGKTGEPTTTSILINESPEDYLMITFDYQELKKIVEGKIK